MKTTLVIMAAGIGSRFGGGIKQLAPVGPAGEIIMDYSIHDALEAGFDDVLFIIRHDLEEDFRRIIGDRIEKICPCKYAFQEVDNLPGGFKNPEGRTKPWGTGHAVLSCKGILTNPAVVINADDYYGKECFKVLHDYIVNEMNTEGDVLDMVMPGFILENTLSENGTVTRGICKTNEEGYLTRIDETSNIQKVDGVITGENAADGKIEIAPDTLTSMNMWAFSEKFVDTLEDKFIEFLADGNANEMKAEFLLPMTIGDLVKAGNATVKVIRTNDKWFGVTYKEDKDYVIESFKKLIDDGVYTNPLFK